jgi:hypothetical protein
MRSTLYPPRPLHAPSAFSQWLGRLTVVALTVGLGLLVGLQYVEPNIRVLAVAAAVVVVGVAWRLDMISALGVLILALPFPRGTVFGSTNLALILLIGILYLLRWTQREVPAPSSSPAFPPVAAFFLTVVLSFYNVTSMKNLYFALQNFQLFVGTLVMFWLIVQNTRTEQDLKRLVGFQVASTLVIALIAMWELNNPGGTLVPGWISFSATAGSETGSNMRVGSMFYDFELLADFCGISLLLLAFLFMRAKGGNARGFLGFMIILVLFTLFATVTRGAIVSLSIAAAYMTFLMRRHVRLVPFTLTVTLLVSAFLAMNWYVASFTNAGNLFMRMEKSEFVGWMPDSRAGAWTDAWERWQIHPLLGHGIYYSAERGGLKFWYWPHNLYLYILNCVGLVGFSVWLWLMATFFRMTRPRVDRLDHPGYAHAFLLVAHTQLVFFMVDQFKIEFWRNPIYQFQVWLMFALWTAAHRVASRTPLPPEVRR